MDIRSQENGDLALRLKGLHLGLMEISMKENSRTGSGMVMGNLVYLMDTILSENSENINHGKH